MPRPGPPVGHPEGRRRRERRGPAPGFRCAGTRCGAGRRERHRGPRRGEAADSARTDRRGHRSCAGEGLGGAGRARNGYGQGDRKRARAADAGPVADVAGPDAPGVSRVNIAAGARGGGPVGIRGYGRHLARRTAERPGTRGRRPGRQSENHGAGGSGDGRIDPEIPSRCRKREPSSGAGLRRPSARGRPAVDSGRGEGPVRPGTSGALRRRRGLSCGCGCRSRCDGSGRYRRSFPRRGPRVCRNFESGSPEAGVGPGQ